MTGPDTTTAFGLTDARLTVGQRTVELLTRPATAAVIAVVALCIVMSFVSPAFPTYSNFAFTARSFSFIAIAAIGQLTVIITKGIDISVGSVMGLAGIVTAMTSASGAPPLVAMLAGLGAGALVGIINGYLISYLGLTAFMVTLGALNIVRGVDVVITQGMPVSGMSTDLKFLGMGYIAGVPAPVVVMIVIAIIWSIVMSRTVFGRHVYAIGGNESAANLAGVRVKAVKFAAYVVCSLMAAIAGILLTARLGVGQPTAGTGYELNIIAATVIGGASFFGGIGNVFGAVMGAALLGLVVNAMALAGVDAFWQQIVIGGVIVLAVIIDKIRAPKAAR
jgi:ribose transport system permease protein